MIGDKNAFHMFDPLLYWAIFGITISKFELFTIEKGFDGVAVFIIAICVEFKKDGARIGDGRVV